jgi:hypothetical protein
VLAGSRVPPGKSRQGHHRTIGERVFDRQAPDRPPRNAEDPRELYFCGSGGGLTSMPRASSASGDQPASSP